MNEEIKAYLKENLRIEIDWEYQDQIGKWKLVSKLLLEGIVIDKDTVDFNL